MNAYLFTDSIFSIVESAGISEVDSIIVLVSGLLLSICYSFFRNVFNLILFLKPEKTFFVS